MTARWLLIKYIKRFYYHVQNYNKYIYSFICRLVEYVFLINNIRNHPSNCISHFCRHFAAAYDYRLSLSLNRLLCFCALSSRFCCDQRQTNDLRFVCTRARRLTTEAEYRWASMIPIGHGHHLFIYILTTKHVSGGNKRDSHSACETKNTEAEWHGRQSPTLLFLISLLLLLWRGIWRWCLLCSLHLSHNLTHTHHMPNLSGCIFHVCLCVCMLANSHTTHTQL